MMHYGKVKVTQSCVSLHDPRDYTVHGVLQARMLECVCVRARACTLGCSVLSDSL